MNLVLLGIMLIAAGIVLCIIGMLALMLRAAKGFGKVSGGGLVLIGPFPIVFGTSTKIVRIMILISIVLVAIFLILSLMFVLWW
ncbi:MAG: hypothetical protein DRJ52_10195 [Thermoprotei archaeon]|nr:MAG: hypothetical protein DRJ52_10195 [Thermoprotei archaeon]RLF00230.1 MAG: hypothetical protein DRJ63_02955 [Thermoprotei archaeon]HDI75339.1 DUF131 domain-containing protein [Thermoprotei archaeon]